WHYVAKVENEQGERKITGTNCTDIFSTHTLTEGLPPTNSEQQQRLHGMAVKPLFEHTTHSKMNGWRDFSSGTETPFWCFSVFTLVCSSLCYSLHTEGDSPHPCKRTRNHDR
uniref:Uncharacterized protein n=1 Tax=Anopheles albimanus TaxID=7167 RepID=A0A182FZ86_ANOAL